MTDCQMQTGAEGTHWSRKSGGPQQIGGMRFRFSALRLGRKLSSRAERSDLVEIAAAPAAPRNDDNEKSGYKA
jgi:hypothetical protein